ncbi:unnamed protein product, partial [marine sediment metagenome]
VLPSSLDILAELEANSPHQATELVAEILAAKDLPGNSITEFREAREVFHRHLNSIPEEFEDYLASLPEDYQMRQLYARTRVALTEEITLARLADESVEKILTLRLPDVVFLLFNVGWKQITAVFVDMACGKVVACGFRKHDLTKLHQEYQQSLLSAGSLPDPGPVTRKAVDRLLAGYEKILGPLLEGFLPYLKDRHLKIFPRLQMNTVPLHAMKIGCKRLIEHCQVSYGLSLGLFLEMHMGDADSEGIRIMTVYDDQRAPLFEGILM